MKKIKTLNLKDEGQDFTKLDILDNGVILGYSIMFSENRITLIGIGTLDGSKYYTFGELKRNKFKDKLKGLYIYIKKTGEPDPLPWEAQILNYPII